MKQFFYHFSIVVCLAGASVVVHAKPAEAKGDRLDRSRLDRPGLDRSRLDRSGLGKSLLRPRAEVTVKGTVKDDKGEVLPGVSVVIKGTTRGSLTDEKGNFELSVSGQDTELVFSFVGYVQQQIRVNNESVLNVVLLSDTKALDEFVVVGYGTQKKSDVTGAISSLSEAQIRERPVQNVVQAMQGKVAGVDITTNQRPGEVGQIRIRGNRSINASNEPLYVIDGVPLSASEVSAINPNDIASVEVLKDASATAIYGSRGANGVILINYKEG